ncbi:MAG: carboxypeptidase regulatory-like domain-containing protein [Bacteroidales bacterium]|nr:carboxypeptidase regulatory-like domain-containing protein [Bacteroidales bacterium]
MKRIKSLLLLIALGVSSCAQPLVTGSVNGRVFNGNMSDPFENVTVAVYSMPDSATVRGAATDENGYFIIDDLPGGDYLLAASFVGYKAKVFRFQLSENTPEFNVGDIILT